MFSLGGGRPTSEQQFSLFLLCLKTDYRLFLGALRFKPGMAGWEGKRYLCAALRPCSRVHSLFLYFQSAKRDHDEVGTFFFSDRSQFSQLPEKLTFQEKKFEFQIKTIVGHFQTRGKLNFMSVCQVWLSERFEKLKRTLERHESTGKPYHKYALGMCH